MISCGEFHCGLVDLEGRLWFAGLSNRHLGDAYTYGNNDWTQLEEEIQFTSVAVGNHFSLALDVEGDIWGFGKGTNGELGNENSKIHNVIIKKNPLISKKIQFIAAGWDNSLLIDDKGTAYSMGSNSAKLGIGKTNTYNISCYSSPIPLQTDQKFQSAVLGSKLTVLLSIDKCVWICGTRKSQWRLHSEYYNPVKLEIPEEINKIAGGSNHFLFLSINNKVYGFGENRRNALGLGNMKDVEKLKVPPTLINLPPIQSIAAGFCHSIVLDFNGFVWVFGSNYYGQTADSFDIVCLEDNPANPVSDIFAGGNTSFFVSHTGIIYYQGCGMKRDYFREANQDPKELSLSFRAIKQKSARK